MKNMRLNAPKTETKELTANSTTDSGAMFVFIQNGVLGAGSA